MTTNVLLQPWVGPFGGLPPFDQVSTSLFRSALLTSMDSFRQEIAAITNNPEPATFQNTIVPYEDAGRTYNNVCTIFGIWSSSMNDKEFQAVELEMVPIMSGFSDELTQNLPFFQRIEKVYNNRENEHLTDEEKRLVWLTYKGFVKGGAKLDEAQKKRVAEINQRLATLYTEFSQNLLADEENNTTIVDNESDLVGLPQSFISSAASTANEMGHSGKWAIVNTRSAVEPVLMFSANRSLRETVWRKFVSRGDNKDTHDNNERISEILKLRVERANLLGYPTHAHWRLEDSMAKTPERAMQLLAQVWEPAVARVADEVRDMQAIADQEGSQITIEPWDYRYYAEKVRKQRFDLSQNEIKPYLQLDNLRDALFFVADKLFGLSFGRVDNVPVYHPDVTVYEVAEKASQRHIGLWYFDPYARAGKQSGAWMNAYRNQERFKGEVTTIVSNNANFIKGKPGEPILISWDDARTLFHEFGHALHGLLSSVTYPSISGTAVARDYVEFPSQLLEHWLDTEEVLSRFAKHFETGESIPQGLVQKIRKAAKFNEGFATVEYLASAFIDMKLHLAGDSTITPSEFETKTLSELGLPKQIVMRHRTAQFAHVFSGDAYSAGYYSYLWADTLTADAFEAFKEGAGPYDGSVSERLKKYVFSVGNTVDPEVGYRSFRGRDPSVEALMRKRGFAATHINK